LGQPDKAAQVLREVIAEHPDEPKLWAIEQQLQRVEGRIAASQ
jgi:predicted Zn-dependent protease